LKIFIIYNFIYQEILKIESMIEFEIMRSRVIDDNIVERKLSFWKIRQAKEYRDFFYPNKTIRMIIGDINNKIKNVYLK